MSSMNRAEERHAADKGEVPEGGQNKRHLISSVVLHVFVLAAFAFSWSFSSPPDIVVPKYLEARVATEADLAPLKAKKEAESREKQAALDAQRRAQEEKKRQQNAAKKKREAEAKAKAEAQKKAEQEKARIAKIKKEEERKQKEEARRRQEKALQEKKQREEAERKSREQQELARKEQARKEREQALAERLAQAEDEARRRAEVAQRQSEQAAFEASETERYLGLIKQRIEGRWHKPPNSQGQTVVLGIELFPTGELRGVKVRQSSGNPALDQSAQVAVRSVRRFPVPESSTLFDKQFRSFAMSFTP